MKATHWPSFWRGFFDGLGGGPLWRWLRGRDPWAISPDIKESKP